MKAAVFMRYGSADALIIKDVDKPHPKDDEVLIKLHAASINSWDWELLQGKPCWNRLMFGILKPNKIHILGCDVAGQVEAVGRNATHLVPGNAVFGDLSSENWGGFAEYVCASESALTLMPKGMTYAQAAAMPQASLLALQGLGVFGNIQAGQRVLINGAGGGVGSFAIQLAKHFGAQVTGVDCTSKLDFMRMVGADDVIDYTQIDFTKTGQQYDVILDVAAFHAIADYKAALKPLGHFIMVGGSMALANRLMLFGWLISMTSNKRYGILLHHPNEGLEIVKGLFEQGKLTPIIDKTYSLQEITAAMQYFSTAEVKGKIVITL